jgi:hypothetical protein
MGHCSKFGYTLWATVAILVMRYSYRGKFGYALQATAADLAAMIFMLWTIA